MPRLSTAQLSPSLLRMAAEQRGLLTVRQLESGGIDRAAMRALGRRGELFPVLSGLRSLAPATELAPSTMIRAARLAVGCGTACFASAALLQELPAPPSVARAPQLSLPESATRHQARGVGLHWLALAPEDVEIIDGIPVTTPLRLFLDASKKWSRADAIAVVDAGLRSGKLTPTGPFKS